MSYGILYCLIVATGISLVLLLNIDELNQGIVFCQESGYIFLKGASAIVGRMVDDI